MDEGVQNGNTSLHRLLSECPRLLAFGADRAKEVLRLADPEAQGR